MRRHVARLAALLLLVALAATACSGRGGKGGNGGTAQLPAPGIYDGGTIQGVTDPLGAKWDLAGFGTYLPYLKTIAGGATFFEFEWCQVEPQPGQRNWSQLDQIVQQSRQAGFRLFLKIRVGSCWVTGGRVGQTRGTKQKSVSAMPTDLNAYQAFVRDVVRRYSPLGVHEYAIENEVNGAGFWSGSVADYVKLVKLGAQAVHAADPSAKVADAGISSTAYGVAIADRLLRQGKATEAVQAYQRYYQRRFAKRSRDYPMVSTPQELRAALGGEQARRNLDMLAATDQLAAQHVIDLYQLHFYESWDNVPALLDYLHAVLPPGFPIQGWEIGQFWIGGSGDARERAAEVTKTVTQLLAGGLRTVIWLPLSGNGGADTQGEKRYGLLDAGGALRQSGRALQQLAQATARASSWRAVNTGKAEGIVFSGAESSTLVVWSNQDQNAALKASSGAKAESAGGGAVPYGADGLRVGTTPVLVTVNGGPQDALKLLS
jgi:hypothetical protein